MQPLITTIIPTYKRPILLKRAINSVLNQTYQNFQIYVFDNASDDETENIMRAFLDKDSRVTYHRHSKNIGMAANYDYALSNVESPLFSLLSDDDVLLPDFYMTSLKGFDLHPQIAFSAASSVIMDGDGKIHNIPLSTWKREGYYEVPEGILEMCGNFILPTTILFSRKVIEHAKPDWQNLMAWDSDFLLQIAAGSPIFVSKKICGIFLFHSNSYSVSQSLGTSKEIETLNNWSKAYDRIRRRMKVNVCIEPKIYEAAEKKISIHFRNTILRFALNFMAQNKFADASKAIDIYHSFSKPDVYTSCLKKITTFINYIPMSAIFINVLRKVTFTLKRALRKLKFKKHLDDQSKMTSAELFNFLIGDTETLSNRHKIF